MTSHLVTGIGELVTHDPRFDGPLLDAALVAQDGVVVWVGPAGHAPPADGRTDLAGAAVVPGFVDSHTHLAFAGDRAAEFEARMAGTPYTGGGIATTVAATRAASEDDLRRRLGALVAEARAQGVTTVVWLTVHGAGGVNDILAQRAQQYGGHLVIADWAGYSEPHPEWTNADGLHITAAGAAVLSQFIADHVAQVLPTVPAAPAAG